MTGVTRQQWLADPLKYLPPPKAPRCCAQCGVQFAPMLQDAAIYCSQKCKRLAWQIKRNPQHGQRAAAIRAQAEAKRAAAVAQREAAEALAAARVTAALAARRTECRACGLAYCPLPGSGRMVCCSAECSAELVRQGKRTARAADKARRRGAVVEAVDPIKVLEADGWHCYLCGAHTPRTLRGTYEDDAPEVDHVVPLARGGVHGYANLRCACRSCNLSKADMLVDEYLAMLAQRPQEALAGLGDG